MRLFTRRPTALIAFDKFRGGAGWMRWQELTAHSPPFLAPEFFAFVRPLITKGDPLVVESIGGDGNLNGVLPLVQCGHVLHALHGHHTPGFDYIGAADGLEGIWRALRGDSRWHELLLEKVLADSVLATKLPDLARRDGYPAVITPERLYDHLGALRGGCQRDNVLGSHSLIARVWGRLSSGLGIRRRIRRVLSRRTPEELQGAPSRFAVGSWVRVLDEPRIRATLDDRSCLRGLLFMPNQLPTCGGVYRVQRHLRRLRDDWRGMHTVARTVLLEGVTCTGPDHSGCGRHCPLMYRDEWLEPAEAPHHNLPVQSFGQHAHVRHIEAIMCGLHMFGRRDGLNYMPEMKAYAGRRFRVVHALPPVYELDRTVPTRAPIYVLEGVHCSGAALGPKDTCDRACALLWHQDWLVFDDEGTRPMHTDADQCACHEPGDHHGDA